MIEVGNLGWDLLQIQSVLRRAILPCPPGPFSLWELLRGLGALVKCHARGPRPSISSPTVYKTWSMWSRKPHLQLQQSNSSKCPNRLFSWVSPDTFCDRVFANQCPGYWCLRVLGIPCCRPASQGQLSSPGVGPLHRVVFPLLP